MVQIVEWADKGAIGGANSVMTYISSAGASYLGKNAAWWTPGNNDVLGGTVNGGD